MADTEGGSGVGADGPVDGAAAESAAVAESAAAVESAGARGAGTNAADPADDAPLSAMAVVMAGMPGVWRRLLAAHVPDRLGRCRGCRSDTGSGVRWPCSLSRIAADARRVHDQRLARAVDAD